MEEWKPYHSRVVKKATADGALELTDERLEPGEILEVRTLSVTGTNHAAGEYLYLGYWDRVARCYVKHAVNTGATKVVVEWSGFLRLTEGMYPLAYLEAANTGEEVILVVNGQKYIP